MTSNLVADIKARLKKQALLDFNFFNCKRCLKKIARVGELLHHGHHHELSVTPNDPLGREILGASSVISID